MNEHDLLEQLAGVNPSLDKLLHEHRRYNEGELPYVFMGEVVSWGVAEFLNGNVDAVSGVLALLESAYEEGNEDVQGLIALGFVESMPSTGQSGAQMSELLGPLLAGEHRRVNW